MYTNTPFSELLKGLPQKVFQGTVDEHNSDRYAKKLYSCDMLVMMIFGQIQQVRTLISIVCF